MSRHEEDEALSSSPLSSPSSSIFALDDFDSTPLKRAPGPALADNLPPFNPELQPEAGSEPKSRSSSSVSLPNVLRDKTLPGSNPDDGLIAETITAHYDARCGRDQSQAADAAAAGNIQEAPAVSSSQEVPAVGAEDDQDTSSAEKRAATPESPDPIAVATVENTPKNGRKRKAPETSSKSKRKVVVKKARKNDAKKWQAPFVFTDAKSPLAAAPLRAILLHPQAWDVLSPEDQAELRAMLSLDRPASLSQSPSPPHAGSRIGNAPLVPSRPNLDYLRSDDSFRFDCARYTENIESGCHDPDWLAEAFTAHERRKRGDFKEYLAGKLERDWDVVVPEKENDEDGKRSLVLGGCAGSGSGSDTKDDAALGESPVASSVGETRFTEMKLDPVTNSEKRRVAEPEEGEELAHAATDSIG